MKKSILAVAGLAAVAGVVAPVAGAFATAGATQTDYVDVVIATSCTVDYDSTTPHSNTEATKTTSWGSSDNKLTINLANDEADTKAGSTNFTVVCNNAAGYDLKVKPTALSGTASITIPYITTAAAPTAGTASWGISKDVSGTQTWLAPLDGTTKDVTVATSTSGTTGTTVTVTYGAATGSETDTPADTYSGSAVYTITAKSS